MKILNMDRSRCGIVFDLSDHFPTEPGRYTIVQHINDCRASYTIYDHKTNTVLHGDKWHDHYALEDTTGHTFRLSGKQIVRIEVIIGEPSDELRAVSDGFSVFSR